VGLRKAVVWLGLVERDDEVISYDSDLAADGYPADEEEPAGGGVARSDEVLRGSHVIATVRPQTFRDALTIGERFRLDLPVIVNLQDMDTADAKRIVDFMSGLIFGRRGDIQRLSGRVFLIVPPHYRILREQETLADGGFFNQK
jgi:cell division inhibitor SepF